MLYQRILLLKDHAVEVLRKLGELDDTLEFVDLNKSEIESKKPFYKLIVQCEDMKIIF